MYKDKERQKEANRLAKQKQRTKGMTLEGMTEQGMTEMVPPAYIPGVSGDFEMLPERPRFLKLSDGQVLDRASPPVAEPQSGDFIQSIRHCNEAELDFRPLKLKKAT